MAFFAQISLLNVLVFKEHGTFSFDGHPAGFKDISPIGNLESSPGVLLDEQDGYAAITDFADERVERLGFLRVHAGRRLVEQEQCRLGGQRAGDL